MPPHTRMIQRRDKGASEQNRAGEKRTERIRAINEIQKEKGGDTGFNKRLMTPFSPLSPY